MKIAVAINKPESLRKWPMQNTIVGFKKSCTKYTEDGHNLWTGNPVLNQRSYSGMGYVGPWFRPWFKWIQMARPDKRNGQLGNSSSYSHQDNHKENTCWNMFLSWNDGCWWNSCLFETSVRSALVKLRDPPKKLYWYFLQSWCVISIIYRQT